MTRILNGEKAIFRKTKTKIFQDKNILNDRLLIFINFGLKGPVKESDLSNVLTRVCMRFDFPNV